MVRRLSFIVALAAGLLLLAGGGFASDPLPHGGGGGGGGGKIAVADRASGTVSLISAKTDTLIDTVPLPAGTNDPEPMYVVYSPIQQRVFVGDRANDRVVVFKAKDFAVQTTVLAGAGVFHMWASVVAKQLWVSCDVDNVITVIHLRTLDTLAVVPAPVDLVAMGGKPHDVILDPFGCYAYVSFVGVAGDNDYVVQFSTQTFLETNRAAVGKDPHLSLNWWNPYLYVPCQGNDAVFILEKSDLSFHDELAVPGAHGAGMTRNGLFFYTSNLPGGGTDALFTIFTLSNTIVGEPVDAPYDVPHNIALTPNGRKLYLTHSGATNNKVTVYTTKGLFDPVPELQGEVTVGENPFGLDYIP